MSDHAGSAARRSLARTALLVLGVTLAGFGATTAVAAMRGGFEWNLFPDVPPLPRIVQEFTRATVRDGRLSTTVRDRSYLRFRRLDRDHAWRVVLPVRSVSSRLPTTLAITVDDREVFRGEVPTEWTTLDVEVPARPLDDGVVLGFEVEPGRRSGQGPVAIGEVAFRASSWWWLNSGTIVASLALGLAFATLAASAGWDRASVLVVAVSLWMQALLVTEGLAGEGTYSSWATTWGGVVAAIGAAANAALQWTSTTAWRDWRRAVVLASAALMVQGWVLRHPLLGFGDSLFHLHRFQDVQGGSYLFTSDAPGGAFPYPVALYVIANTMAPFVEDTRWLLRAVTLVAHIAASIAVYAAVRRWRPPVEAFWSQVLFLVVPVGFHTVGVAYLTNSFGQSLSVIALSIAVAWPFSSRPWFGAAMLTVAAAIAFLTHLGSFLILSVSLAAFAALCWPRSADRSRSIAVATSLVAAGVLSIVLFYGWFGDTYRAMLSRPPAVAASVPTEPPVMRREAHQTGYVPGVAALRVRLAAVPRYVNRYFGWWLVPLAVLGVAAAWRRTIDPLSRLMAAWLVACGGFFVLGHVSSVDVRYYLAAYPALGILGAQALDRRGLHRWVGGALAVIGAVTGVAYWLEWLGQYP